MCLFSLKLALPLFLHSRRVTFWLIVDMIIVINVVSVGFSLLANISKLSNPEKYFDRSVFNGQKGSKDPKIHNR